MRAGQTNTPTTNQPLTGPTATNAEQVSPSTTTEPIAPSSGSFQTNFPGFNFAAAAIEVAPTTTQTTLSQPMQALGYGKPRPLRQMKAYADIRYHAAHPATRLDTSSNVETFGTLYGQSASKYNPTARAQHDGTPRRRTYRLESNPYSPNLSLEIYASMLRELESGQLVEDADNEPGLLEIPGLTSSRISGEFPAHEGCHFEGTRSDHVRAAQFINFLLSSLNEHLQRLQAIANPMDEDQDMEGGVAANGLDAEGYLRGTWCLQSKCARVRLTVRVPARQLLRIEDEDPVKFNTKIKPALSPPGQPFNESGWVLLRRRVLAADAFGPDGLLRNELVSLPREITHEDMTNGTADPQVSRLVVRLYMSTLNPRVQPFEPRSRSLNGTTDRCVLTSQPRTRSAEDTLVSPAKRPRLDAHSDDGQGPNESAVGLVVARPGTPHPATGQFSFEPNAASSAILATKTRGLEPYWVTANSVLQQHL
jgi:hypothetical protein